jgi:hypothetical protein
MPDELARQPQIAFLSMHCCLLTSPRIGPGCDVVRLASPTLSSGKLFQGFHRSPGLDNRGRRRKHGQEQYHQCDPKGPELLRISTISPQLSPTDRRGLEDLLVKLKQPISPLIKIQQSKSLGHLKRPIFVERLLLLLEKRHGPAVPEWE